MANGTFYADAVNGNDANAGTSEALAKQTLNALFGLGTGGGNVYYVQSGGDYVLTTTQAVSIPAGDSTNGPNRIEGYTTTPGTRDGRPTVTSSTASINLLQTAAGANYIQFVHLRFTHTGSPRGYGFVPGAGSSTLLYWEDCVFDGLAAAIYGDYASFWVFVQCSMQGCEIKNCTGNGLTNSDGFALHDCWIHDNVTNGINLVNHPTGSGFRWLLDRCIISGNGGQGALLNGSINQIIEVKNSIFYGNTSDGLQINGTQVSTVNLENNIFYGNGGYGVNLGTAKVQGLNRNNAYGSNTSGSRNGLAAGLSDVSLSGNPFTNAGSGDFSLNSTAGAGAACRAVGYPGTFPGGSSVGYLDIGASQHQDAGGGGGGMQVVIRRGGLSARL